MDSELNRNDSTLSKACISMETPVPLHLWSLFRPENLRRELVPAANKYPKLSSSNITRTSSIPSTNVLHEKGRYELSIESKEFVCVELKNWMLSPKAWRRSVVIISMPVTLTHVALESPKNNRDRRSMLP